jgi:hypothetical protein
MSICRDLHSRWLCVVQAFSLGTPPIFQCRVSGFCWGTRKTCTTILCHLPQPASSSSPRINLRIVTRSQDSLVIFLCAESIPVISSLVFLICFPSGNFGEKFHQPTYKHGASLASCRTQWTRCIQTGPHEPGPGSSMERPHNRNLFVSARLLDLASKLGPLRAFETLQQNLRSTTA